MVPSEPQAAAGFPALRPSTSNLPTTPLVHRDSRLRQNYSEDPSSTLLDLVNGAKLKLEQSSTNHTLAKMDNHGNQQGGSRSGQSGQQGYGQKGHGDPGVLDGLLPRIETRGQSRGSGRSKYDDKSKRGSTR
jgi:hypothetical protein